MKIDKNLFEHLTIKGFEVLNKFGEFINQNELEEKIEWLYDDLRNIIKINYKISSYNSLDGNRIIPHIIISHVKGGNLDSFVVRVNGDILIEKQVEKKTLFGKINRITEKSYKCLSLECYPFVCEKDEIYGYNVRPRFFNETYINFDEFISKISNTNYSSEIDIKTLEAIQNFIANIISGYSQNLNEVSNTLESEISTIDKNGDGKVDIVDASDLMKLLNKNQSKIIEVDKDFIHKFIRISNYLKQRSQNIQSIFSSLLHEESIKNREEVIGILKNQIHNYELLMFHSINMVVSINTYNLIAFYEIYETFDKLNVFNSNWENEVAEKLTNIGTKLDDLMYSMYNMEQNIVSELSHLSYVTQESFEDLNKSVTGQLKEIGSSIDTNNLLAGIQAYQLYKINKNTKGLRP
jgi:hypothetical protein